MEPDSNKIRSAQKTGQAAILLERLETLRSELGIVGEDLIRLLQNAGAAPLAKPEPIRKKKVGNG